MPDSSIAESQWLRQQVENHIFFGLFAKKWPLYPLLIAVAIAIIPLRLLQYGSIDLLTLNMIFCFGVYGFISRKYTLYRQATIGWVVTKLTIAFVAFMSMTAGTLASLAAGRSDALPNFLIGLIWIPSLELLPRFIAKQKFITLLRLVLSIPVIWLGIASGNWHWN